MISSFQGEYRFLSNFWRCPVPFRNHIFPSSENAYVAAKTNDIDVWKKLADPSITSGQAKRIGRELILREDWDRIRLGVMTEIVFSKFENNPDLMELLIQTGDQELIEVNTWGDRFWGQCPIGNGSNHLGKILMMVRDTYSIL